MDANEEINTSYINNNLEKVKQNIDYYFNEPNEQRKYEYLRTIKNTFRKLGTITLRNVVDLKRNIDNTFKNEPNYKNKRAKLLNLDNKRKDITKLIGETEKIVTEDDVTFFNTATDEELSRVIVQLKIQLGKCTHNLIEIERQIIDFLNQIKYQSNVIEKLRLIKYLKDQFILNLKRSVAEKISSEYLETQTEEEIQINLEEVKNGFVASGYNLFDFIMITTLQKKFHLKNVSQFIAS